MRREGKGPRNARKGFKVGRARRVRLSRIRPPTDDSGGFGEAALPLTEVTLRGAQLIALWGSRICSALSRE